MGMSDHNSVLAFFSRSNPTAQTFERIAAALGFPRSVASALRGQSSKELESFADVLDCSSLLYFGSAEVKAPIMIYPIVADVAAPLHEIGSGRDLFKLGWLQERITPSTAIPSQTDLARALDIAVLADAGISSAAPLLRTSANNSRFMGAFNSVLEKFELYLVDLRWWDRSEAHREAMRAAEQLADAIGAGPASIERQQIISFAATLE
jgi:hypothetical protein